MIKIFVISYLNSIPFVFAAWVANKRLPNNFISDFNSCLKYELNNINQALLQEKDSYSHCENAIDYLNNKISYNLDSEKLKSMHFFLKNI